MIESINDGDVFEDYSFSLYEVEYIDKNKPSLKKINERLTLGRIIMDKTTESDIISLLNRIQAKKVGRIEKQVVIHRVLHYDDENRQQKKI